MGIIRWLIQVFAVTKLNLQTLPQRKGSAISAVVGIAGVVAVFVGVLSISQGFRRTLSLAGSPDTAIVTRGGADTEMTSILMRDDVRVIADAPGLLRDADGPLASGELFVIISLPKRSTGTDANVPLRGVERPAFKIREKLKFLAGRPFEWGRNEAVVGVRCMQEFAGIDLGSKLMLSGAEWTIVGVFADGGSIAESELWADAAVLQPLYDRGTTFQSVRVRLVSSDAFQEFKDVLTTDPRLNVQAERETDFYSAQSTLVSNTINTVGGVIAFIMGIGAVFGAVNTMYSSVSARTREIATLRALGFPAIPVVLSILIESLALGVAGGALGAGLAWVAFDEYRASTINWQTFSQVAFAFDVTGPLLLEGILYAVLLGLVGGLLPAIRAVRMPVVSALREM